MSETNKDESIKEIEEFIKSNSVFKKEVEEPKDLLNNQIFHTYLLMCYFDNLDEDCFSLLATNDLMGILIEPPFDSQEPLKEIAEISQTIADTINFFLKGSDAL